jgi:membrane associated rhomboid family serine protease
VVGKSATLAVFTATAILTCASLLHPTVLVVLQRSPQILAGQWWRLVTPVLVERGGWGEITFNLVALAAFGAVVERLWGSRRWVLFYLTGCVTGEAIGLAWQPVGAGSSVAVCGLLGAWAAWSLRESRAHNVAGVLVLGIAVVLSVSHNLHGPPVLVCAALALLLGPRMRHRERPQNNEIQLTTPAPIRNPRPRS